MSSAFNVWLFCHDCQEVYWEGQADDKIYCPKCQRSLKRAEPSLSDRVILMKVIAKCQDQIDWIRSSYPQYSDTIDALEEQKTIAKNLLRQLH